MPTILVMSIISILYTILTILINLFRAGVLNVDWFLQALTFATCAEDGVDTWNLSVVLEA